MSSPLTEKVLQADTAREINRDLSVGLFAVETEINVTSQSPHVLYLYELQKGDQRGFY